MYVIPVNFSLKSRIDDSYDNRIRSIVGNELYFGIEDIIINGERIQTAEDRRHQIEKGADSENDLKYIYSLEKSVEDVGRRLDFKEIGTYDFIHFVWSMLKDSEPVREKILSFNSKNIKTFEDYNKLIDNMIDIYSKENHDGNFRE